jgi:DNA-binding transcriptional MocR family regulator
VEACRHPDVVPLGAAIPGAEFVPTAKLQRIVSSVWRRHPEAMATYGIPPGREELRRQVALRARDWGVSTTPDEIIITNGCMEAVNLCLRAVARPGDTIAIESPTYFGLLHALEALDLKALELPTDATEGIDLAALQSALAGNRVAACLLSSSFNNPLGCTMPDERKLAVLDVLARHDVPLIEDDIYGDIYFGPERPRPYAALDRAGRTIYCSSFSKTIAPGYRIGWLVAGRHVRRALDHKFATTLCGPALPQIAFADFLASGGYEHHLRRIRREFEDNVGRMLRAVEDAFPPRTRVSRPAGGFVLWVELPKGVRSRKLLDEALQHDICFAPGDVFSATDRYAHCLRLSCGYSWDEKLEQGVRRLGALAAARASRLSG